MNESITWGNCNKCGKELRYGSAHVSINFAIEQPEYYPATDRVSVTVFQAEQLVSLCGDCGNALDKEAVITAIEALPLRNHEQN